jgi:hypothetical protein
MVFGLWSGGVDEGGYFFGAEAKHKLKISKNLCDLILLKTHISHVKAQLITFSYDITLFAYILKIREV